MYKNQITKYARLKDGKFLKYFTRYIFSSLCFRLKIVKDVLENIDSFYETHSSFSKGNLQIVFNLRKSFSFRGLNTSYLSKKSGASIFVKLPLGYSKFNYALWDNFLVPINESSPDRFSFHYRPYRYTYESFFTFKKFFSKGHYNFWFNKLKINSFFCKSNLDWLLKNCPVNKFVIKSWFFSNSRKVSYSELFDLMDQDYYVTNIFFSLVNFMVNGLLRVI